MKKWLAGQRSTRVTNVIVLALAGVTLGQGMLFSCAQREESDRQAKWVQCQTQINKQFLVVLEDRSQTLDADRENMARTVEQITKAKPGSGEGERALRRFLAEKKSLDARRKKLPYPNLTGCGHG